MDDDTSRWSRRLDFDWHFLKLLVFHFFRREEEGIICITAEEMKGKFGHSAFMIYHALLTSEGDVKSISDIVFEDSDALHSTADHFLNNMEGNGARITQLTDAESRA